MNKEVIKLSDLSENIIIKDNILSLVNTKKVGRNNLNDVKWFTYSFKNEINGYKAVNLMLFKIDKTILTQASENSDNIVFENISTLDTPNIDAKSGNIHPSHEYISDSTKNGEKICQLVLCKNDKNDPGPNYTELVELDDKYCYSFVHKSCYFPRIDNIKPSNDWRYNLLKEIAAKLPKKCLSTELYNEIYNSKSNS